VSRDRISPKPLFEERKSHNVYSRIVHGETKLSKRTRRAFLEKEEEGPFSCEALGNHRGYAKPFIFLGPRNSLLFFSKLLRDERDLRLGEILKRGASALLSSAKRFCIDYISSLQILRYSE